MGNKYELLHELIDLVDQYEQEFDERPKTVIGFSVWLNQKLGYFSPGVAQLQQHSPDLASTQNEDDQDTVLTMLITYLYRYAKHYSKKALENTPLSTLDEFGFLVTLLEKDSLTKSELINLHLLEITSGIEIIKRLTKQGLLETFPDAQDRRSRRVRLTDLGRAALAEALPQLKRVARIVSADLSSEERRVLLPVLNRLNDFHIVIHREDKKTSLPEIEAKYLSH